MTHESEILYKEDLLTWPSKSLKAEIQRLLQSITDKEAGIERVKAMPDAGHPVHTKELKQLESQLEDTKQSYKVHLEVLNDRGLEKSL